MVVDESEEGVLSAVCCTLRHSVTRAAPRLPIPQALFVLFPRVCRPPAHTMAQKHWLMKAEPDSRIVKGKDVKVRVSAPSGYMRARLEPHSAVQRGRLRVRQDDAVGGRPQCRG